MEENNLQEQVAALQAAYETLLEEQRAIRKILESMDLSDDAIGRAAQRYAGKMAVVRGAG